MIGDKILKLTNIVVFLEQDWNGHVELFQALTSFFISAKVFDLKAIEMVDFSNIIIDVFGHKVLKIWSKAKYVSANQFCYPSKS